MKKRDTERCAPVLERERDPETMSDVEKLTDLDFEYQAAVNAAGKEEKTYGIWGPIWRFLQWKDSLHKPHNISKKVCMVLLLLTGWMGGHRYYQGRYVSAVLYTAFCWSGVPLLLCVTDFMELVPIKADENGRITM
ncbi:MAG: TM2 domain-containing protein [Faecalibacterium sp.]